MRAVFRRRTEQGKHPYVLGFRIDLTEDELEVARKHDLLSLWIYSVHVEQSIIDTRTLGKSIMSYIKARWEARKKSKGSLSVEQATKGFELEFDKYFDLKDVEEQIFTKTSNFGDALKEAMVFEDEVVLEI